MFLLTVRGEIKYAVVEGSLVNDPLNVDLQGKEASLVDDGYIDSQTNSEKSVDDGIVENIQSGTEKSLKNTIEVENDEDDKNKNEDEEKEGEIEEEEEVRIRKRNKKRQKKNVEEDKEEGGDEVENDEDKENETEENVIVHVSLLCIFHEFQVISSDALCLTCYKHRWSASQKLGRSNSAGDHGKQ